MGNTILGNSRTAKREGGGEMTEHEDWHVKLFEAEEEEWVREIRQKVVAYITKEARKAVEHFETELLPFSLYKATQNQTAAIRFLAQQVGFENLRGFWKWVEVAKLTYYDLIKIASP